MKRIFYIMLTIILATMLVYAGPVTNIEVSKNGNNYFVKMTCDNQDFACEVVYRKLANNQYNRELRCALVKGVSDRVYLKDTLKVPTETWQNFDKLIYNKYGEYSLWHNNPASLVKEVNELKKAKSYYSDPACTYNVINGIKNCSYKIDFTKDMTKQEKEDYFRAKDFEAEYENYKRYRGY